MNSPNKLQAISNIATIVVSLLLSVVLVKQFLLPPPQGLGKGTSLKSSLASVDWAKNGRTLILAISTGCHFCSESGPFFQKIANQRSAGVKLLAVLPQPAAQGRAYLDGLGVHVDDVLQAPLNSIGVTGLQPSSWWIAGQGVRRMGRRASTGARATGAGCSEKERSRMKGTGVSPRRPALGGRWHLEPGRIFPGRPP